MKLNFLLLFIIALTGHIENCHGQSTSIQKGYKDWYIGDFRCGVYIPPSYDPAKKYPLVVYLHGKGDTTTRNIGWYHAPAALAEPCIVLTPKCPLSETGEWGNSVSKDIPPMVKKTFEMIEMIKKQYNLDEDRFYIYGISMGAIGTFGIIQKLPGFFTAGYAVCGWGDPGIAPQLSKIPFWIFHGDQDDIVPVEGSRRVYKAVLDYGGKQIRYTEFKGVKHDAQNYLPTHQLYTWLLKQRKGSIHGSPDKVLNIEAKVEDGNRIALRWQKPSQATATDKEIWYYKIYRNNNLIGEVDGKNATYTDRLTNKHADVKYAVSAVNYYFKESDLSAPAHVTTAPE